MAVAGSERTTSGWFDRSRSRSRSRRDGARPARLSGSQAPPSAGPSSVMTSESRRVRTVPPSAVYEPPTPPTADVPLASTTLGVATPKRRHLRYSSSSSSGESEGTDSDAEPPWWTFTRGGMQRLRKRGEELQRGQPEQRVRAAGAENGPRRQRFRRSRGSEMDDASGQSTPNNPSPAEARPRRAFQQRASFRPSSSRVLRRMSGFGNDSTRTASGAVSDSAAPPMARSSSAPSSPVDIDETPTRADLLAVPVTEPRRGPARPLTVVTPGNLTDSETVPGTAARPRGKRLFSLATTLHEGDEGDSGRSPLGGNEGDDEEASPTRPRARRLPSHQLKLRLPPPISQHFTHGWPHAGSWQDALYGTYVEEPQRLGGKDKAESRRGSKEKDQSRRGSKEPQSRRGSKEKGKLSRRGTAASVNGDGPALSTPKAVDTPRKRTKSRRRRHFPDAQVPPTPGGLGFVPSDITTARTGSSWTGSTRITPTSAAAPPPVANGHGDVNPFDRIVEELERQETLVTEKGGDSVKARRRWLCFGRDHPQRRKYIADLDWRARYRRMLFLDARVTVYIRFLNLSVIVVLLGLAVTIRLELDSLHLPGIIGASTTIIIAYSSFTIVHALTAVWREYFGRPIGLWGLRSKMLWVCLDLLFVALWSSATTLAADDYISTPLDCTPGSPWWTNGLDYYDFTTAFNLTHSQASLTGVTLPVEIVHSGPARAACRRQVTCIVLSVVALLLYGGNMVLSLFRIFETVRRTANPGRAMTV